MLQFNHLEQIRGNCSHTLRLILQTLQRIISYEMGNSSGEPDNHLRVSHFVYVTCETGYQQRERGAHKSKPSLQRAAQTSVASRSSA